MNRIFMQKLEKCYNELLNCDLVKYKNNTTENLKHFRYILNGAQPSNKDEYCYKNMIYVLFGKNIASFHKYIINNNMPYLVLWLNSRYIIEHFDLIGIVYMKWSQGLYYIYKFIKKTFQNNTPNSLKCDSDVPNNTLKCDSDVLNDTLKCDCDVPNDTLKCDCDVPNDTLKCDCDVPNDTSKCNSDVFNDTSKCNSDVPNDT